MKTIWNNYRHFILRAVNLLLLVVVCVVYHNVATERKQEAMDVASVSAAGQSYEDGSYEGTGTGFGGDIVVNVTIKDQQISDIEIKEAKSEDAAYLDNAKKIIDTMLQNQTSEVDVASGATYSSKGIIEAVQNALKEAS